MNNLRWDISMVEEFGDIVGYTQEEPEGRTFRVDGAAAEKMRTRRASSAEENDDHYDLPPGSTAGRGSTNFSRSSTLLG